MAPDGRFFLETIDQRLLRLDRCVDSEVGKVEEEGLLLVPLDKIDRLVGKEIRKVLPVLRGNLGTGHEVEMAAIGDDCLVKSSLARVIFWFIAKVPFAKHAGHVTRLLKDIRNRLTVQGRRVLFWGGTIRRFLSWPRLKLPTV